MKKRKRHRVIVGLLAAASVAVAGVAVATSRPAGYVLPDSAITPGVVLSTDPAVVCISGYTATVRVALTPAEARQVDAAYHWTYGAGKQEYDHLIPLELGGDNGVKNIWPQPIAEAHIKDGLENRLHALACSHQITLQNAQTCIRSDWAACARRYP